MRLTHSLTAKSQALVQHAYDLEQTAYRGLLQLLLVDLALGSSVLMLLFGHRQRLLCFAEGKLLLLLLYVTLNTRTR